MMLNQRHALAFVETTEHNYFFQWFKDYVVVCTTDKRPCLTCPRLADSHDWWGQRGYTAGSFDAIGVAQTGDGLPPQILA